MTHKVRGTRAHTCARVWLSMHGSRPIVCSGLGTFLWQNGKPQNITLAPHISFAAPFHPPGSPRPPQPPTPMDTADSANCAFPDLFGTTGVELEGSGLPSPTSGGSHSPLSFPYSRCSSVDSAVLEQVRKDLFANTAWGGGVDGDDVLDDDVRIDAAWAPPPPPPRPVPSAVPAAPAPAPLAVDTRVLAVSLPGPVTDAPTVAGEGLDQRLFPLRPRSAFHPQPHGEPPAPQPAPAVVEPGLGNAGGAPVDHTGFEPQHPDDDGVVEGRVPGEWPVAPLGPPPFHTVAQPMRVSVSRVAGSALLADFTATRDVAQASGPVNLRLWGVDLGALGTEYETRLYFLEEVEGGGKFRSHRNPACPRVAEGAGVKFVIMQDLHVRGKGSECGCEPVLVTDLTLEGVEVLGRANVPNLYGLEVVDHFNVAHGSVPAHPDAGAYLDPAVPRNLLLVGKRAFQRAPGHSYCAVAGCCVNNSRSDATRTAETKARLAAERTANAERKAQEKAVKDAQKAHDKAMKIAKKVLEDAEKEARKAARLAGKAKGGRKRERETEVVSNPPAFKTHVGGPVVEADVVDQGILGDMFEDVVVPCPVGAASHPWVLGNVESVDV